MPSGDIDVQIALLEERMETLSGRLQELSVAVDGLNKLAIQGRMAIIVLIAIGSFVGWILAQTEAVRSIFSGRH